MGASHDFKAGPCITMKKVICGVQREQLQKIADWNTQWEKLTRRHRAPLSNDTVCDEPLPAAANNQRQASRLNDH